MKFSLVALATLVGTAVADLDPIVIKVMLFLWGDIEGSNTNTPVSRAPSSSIPATTLSCK